jgi:spermidine synthase
MTRLVYLKNKHYHFLIFITGACVLALELLASRVNTPYFGVSLYIWSAILATTLLFLALGYYFGGLISARLKRDDLEIFYLWSPLIASLFIVIACLVYPVLFPIIGNIDLLFGSFVGSMILLGAPLICLSAMNPMLIAMERQENTKGDAGAGRIFFISTTGSVLGVFITAFLLIPNISNFNALLGISLLLATIVTTYTIILRTIALRNRAKLLTSSILCIFICISLLIFKENYLNQIALIQGMPATSRVAAEYNSYLGNTKVINHSDEKSGKVLYKTLIQDGHVLNNTLPDGTSLDSYTYILEALAMKFSPQNDHVLVLGLGAGIVPMQMYRRGSNVTVIELDAGIMQSSIEHFNFDSANINLIQEDARTFVRHCPRSYDTIVVDLFQGDGVPDYLLTVEFFSEIKKCMTMNSTLVMNTFYNNDNNNDDINPHILATIARIFPVLYQAVWMDDEQLAPANTIINRYLVGRFREAEINETPVIKNMPALLKKHYDGPLSMLKIIPLESLADIAVITDEKNFYNLTYAKMQMAYRNQILKTLPANFLTN